MDGRLGKTDLDNLKRLAAAGKQITIRVPLIQGFNADEASITDIINFAADELNVHDIHFSAVSHAGHEQIHPARPTLLCP